MVNVVKFLHLLFVLVLVGTLIASYLFSLLSFRSKDALLQRTTLDFAIRIDWMALILIFFLFSTGSMLVIPKGFTFQTPWIQAAMIFLTVVMVLQALSLARRIWQRAKGQFHVGLLLHINFYVMMFIYIMIIHDAVTKTTYLRL